jgi:alkyl sulfatase BDS1-like metallo-beta-lactamase superfamily hydrolase
MRTQRDAYGHLNNTVLHLVNQGVTINEIQNVYKQPKSLQDQWAAHSYHGSESHNSRAVVNRYIGYWDANPATLDPLSPRDSAPLYVEMMGGADKIIAKGKQLYNEGKYRHAVEILNKLVFAQPANQPAKDLLADVYEQIGYQKESPSQRNSFLAGAYELRNGMPTGASPKTSGPDMIAGMSTGLWLDFLAVQLDGTKVEGKRFAINFVTPDNGEKYAVELSNATLTNIEGYQIEKPDLTITINRSDLNTIMMGKATFDDMLKQGKAKFEGSRQPFDLLRSSMVRFTIDFEVLPGTGGKRLPEPTGDPFEVSPPSIHVMTN